MKAKSDREASSGENSTSSVYWRAWATAAPASAFTCSGVMRSLWVMCVSLVAMNTWMRRRAAGSMASQQRSMSLRAVRESPQITGPSTEVAMACTDSKSPWLAMGKPASMTSTPRRASCSAISTFSPWSSEMPGDCSPSRRVVSKMISRFGSSATCRAGAGGVLMGISVPFAVRSGVGSRAGAQGARGVEREGRASASVRKRKNLPARSGQEVRRAPISGRSPYIRRSSKVV